MNAITNVYKKEITYAKEKIEAIERKIEALDLSVRKKLKKDLTFDDLINQGDPQIKKIGAKISALIKNKIFYLTKIEQLKNKMKDFNYE